MKLRLVALLVFALFPAIALAEDQLWGPVDMKKWKEIPCLIGRLATEADVKEGRAAFYVTGDSAMKPLDIPLPACAIHYDADTKMATPVILIQAVQTTKITAVGYRLLSGGNGVCLLSELEILKGPDERFK